MPSWPENPRLISTEVPRVDGLAKAHGKIKYPSDVHPEGMLFGVMLTSPHAHARVRQINTSKAEAMPGVKAVHVIADKENATLRYQGDEIAAVAAVTEEQARDAARAIEVDYEILPHAVTEEQAMAEGAPKVTPRGNVQKGRQQTRGEPDEAMAKAEVVIEGTYSAPVITHVCLETHGQTVRWDSDSSLTAWASTQSVTGVASGFADAFQIRVSDVTCLTEVMGGGFGSKFGPDAWGIAAAHLAKKAGKPVRLFLDRAHEHRSAGNRPSGTGKVKLGATKDGQLLAMTAETHGTGGVGTGSNMILPYVYSVPNTRVAHTDVFVNGGAARAMRAPRHPSSCIVSESIMDDLAEKLGMDPLELRLKNLPEGDFKTPIYQAEVAIGAKLIGWDQRKPRGQNGKGPIKRGFGMGLHTWGGGAAPDKQVACVINPDGSVELRSATQDIGTGARTVLAIVAAELLGLEPTDIKSNIGNSTFPPGQSSGGSTTTASMTPPTFDAVSKARDELFKRVGKSINEDPAKLSLKDGKLLASGEPVMSFKDACRKIGMMPISVIGEFQEGLSDSGVGGCQFAEVEVDTETGVVRVKKIVAVQDSGLIIDRLTWDSQVYGGVIMGLNYGLFEERVMDPTTGVFLNADMELYRLAGPSDIPEIIIEAYDTPEMRKRGVIGIGEPPTISTAAAIGNAVSNAIGVRVPKFPMSPMNVLDALAAAQGQEG